MSSTESNETRPCWVILGATATGKTSVALEVAERHSVEIVSVDSMKVYRDMDIGTAKAGPEARVRVPFHMMDVAAPEEKFSVGRYYRMAGKAIEDITRRGKRPLLVGGSALYLKALVWGLFEGPGRSEELRKKLRREAEEKGRHALHERLKEIDPESAEKIHPNDLKRVVRALEVYELTGEPLSDQQQEFDREPELDVRMVGLWWPREVLHERIGQRVDRMLEEGLEDEVRRLRDRLGPQASQAVGYKELVRYMDGEIDREEAVRLIKRNTRRLAKHQETWFRKFEPIHWIDRSCLEDVADAAREAERYLLGNFD